MYENSTRRRFLKCVSAGTISALMAPMMMCSTKKQRRKPNIIFILSDDIGYGDLGCYGQKDILTPHLDKMAANGVRFTQCYAGATVCCPSRSALLTGKHLGHTRHRANKSYITGEAYRLPFRPDDVTFGNVLQTVGYYTALIGKWHLGGECGSKDLPPDHGFDYSFGPFTECPGTGTHYPKMLYRNGEKVVIQQNGNDQKNYFIDDILTDDAIDLINNVKDKPFCLYLAYKSAHAEIDPPTFEPYSDKDWEELEKGFAAMVTGLDKNVGRILSQLTKLKLEEDTIVFFTSDNGPHHEGGHDHTYFDSNGSLRGFKRDLYDGGIRVPMIVNWKGTVPAGSVNDLVWYFPDVLPTFADIAGAQCPDDIDGISVLPTLLGHDQDMHDRYLYWEFHVRKAFNQAVRWRNYKVVRFGKNMPAELYDLEQDMGEQNNIAGKFPDVVMKMTRMMDAAHVENEYYPTE